MSAGFPPEIVEAVLIRDGGRCSMCGARATTANHRANRGHGGYQAANRPSNGCAICWDCNGRIESDPAYADLARERGVKISRYEDAELVPYRSPLFLQYVLLHDDWSMEWAEPIEPR